MTDLHEKIAATINEYVEVRREGYEEAATAILALVVPDGWVVVPREQLETLRDRVWLLENKCGDRADDPMIYNAASGERISVFAHEAIKGGPRRAFKEPSPMSLRERRLEAERRAAAPAPSDHIPSHTSQHFVEPDKLVAAPAPSTKESEG